MLKKMFIGGIVACSLCLSACGAGASLSVNGIEKNTILVKEDGSIQAGFVESFSKKYYDKEELETFAKEQVDTYNEANKSKVEMKKLKVKDEEAKMLLTFSSVDEYNDFLVSGLVVCTLEEALENSDLVLPEKVYEVKDDKKVSLSDISKPEQYTVIYTNEKLDIMIDGTIKYYDNGAYLKSNKMETTSKEDEYSVIIFK